MIVHVNTSFFLDVLEKGLFYYI